MKVVLLAAGKGERLEPITHTRPKPFVPVLGETLIERNLKIVRRIVKDPEIFVVIPEEYPPEYESFFSRLQGVNLVKQGERKGTGGALQYVPKFSNDELLIFYGDIYTTSNSVERVVSEPGNSMLGVEVPNPSEYGSLKMDEGGYLQGIVEKSPNPPSNVINGGIYKLSSSILDLVDKLELSPRGEYEFTDAITTFARRSRIKVVKSNDFWRDVGKPWDVIDINKVELDSIPGKIEGELEENVKLMGKVVIEEGAKILSGTRIEGPAYIGRNCVVGPNAFVRPYTVLVSNVKIGSFVEIKESVVMEGTKIPHLSYVGDSVISEDVNFGAGTLVANLRFDEKEVYMNIKGKRQGTGRKKMGTVVGGHVRTGINVSILPGIRIGAYAMIYPGAVVNRDVNRGEFFKG
ncbi:Bifunctional protein GlmU [Metallosphaera sp. J1]|uniref:bifunctional sugar-1-phosphate nucleotidylyltransferase/acetyltransferase n=1 Tax=Metallosphaera TaxID=41980 RepID=UPI001EDF58F2|nr:bifunctional sugar-1-phosphate nucleotidylyltransferase/acetyltransferase [Metallosphaera javensis (ex Hofmann et al. 2022)]MCG3107799.1 Bifunctional protein GlmU [Metallosphaera javensis (ex Hofmann et al. 2022)]BCS92050.1 MAG: nucleotidyltransferase [Metallosphaera javensis (ex Sakai et al. 2022)]